MKRVMQGKEENKHKPLERYGRYICSKFSRRQDHSGNEEANEEVTWENVPAGVQIFLLNLRPTAAASPLMFYFVSVCKCF